MRRSVRPKPLTAMSARTDRHKASVLIKLASRFLPLWTWIDSDSRNVVPGPSPALLLASRLAAMGIERGPSESLADTTARAMGISFGELRAKLWVIAGGS